MLTRIDSMKWHEVLEHRTYLTVKVWASTLANHDRLQFEARKTIKEAAEKIRKWEQEQPGVR